MSDKKYKIAWVSEITEAQGEGTAKFDYVTARGIADDLNKKTSILRHTPVLVKTPQDTK